MAQLPLSPPPHVTLSHAFATVHMTLQLLPLQVMSLQAEPALQTIVHDDPVAHVMLLQASAEAQVMSQCTFLGHVNEAPLLPSSTQMCGVTLMSHDLHSEGHAFSSTTQNPLSHTRPDAQSVWTVQASRSLLRSTRHALAIQTPASVRPRSSERARAFMGRSGSWQPRTDRRRSRRHRTIRGSDRPSSHSL